ncbi:MAG TPA: Mrp/NBP35 family ATP-binding protein [Firmicutes bacterium]|nr:Mrp/NBP35 family ATP-binding protein [Bacillota bacterium]
MSEQSGFTKLPPNELNHIQHVIAVMSGKGGVGKSSVTALIAVEANRKGYRCGILDADITGPSMPKMFGISQRPENTGFGLIAPETRSGIRLMSLNLLLDNEDAPVIWRGPLIASAVRQFWTEVVWGDLDYLIVDLPPGTGDAPLTVMQSLPLDGVVIVSSPQDLVGMVVAKAIKMCQHMNIPVFGLVENMSFIECPKCGEKIYPFGRPAGDSLAQRNGLKFLGALPIDPAFAQACDRGQIENYHGAVGLDVLLTTILDRIADST